MHWFSGGSWVLLNSMLDIKGTPVNQTDEVILTSSTRKQVRIKDKRYWCCAKWIKMKPKRMVWGQVVPMVSSGGEANAEGYSVVKSQADTKLQEGCFKPCEPRVKCRGQARIWRVTATSLGWAWKYTEARLHMTCSPPEAGASRWCMGMTEEALRREHSEVSMPNTSTKGLSWSRLYKIAALWSLSKRGWCWRKRSRNHSFYWSRERTPRSKDGLWPVISQGRFT